MLLGPIGGQIGEARDAEAAGKGTIRRGFDNVWRDAKTLKSLWDAIEHGRGDVKKSLTFELSVIILNRVISWY
jgi:hypothetical protein